MNKLLLTIIIAFAMETAVHAQTVNTTNGPENQLGPLGNLAAQFGIPTSVTNYALVPFVGRSLDKNQWSFGALLVANVTQNNTVGLVVGFDSLTGGGKLQSLDLVSGGVTLKYPIYPGRLLDSNTNSWLYNVKVTPYALELVGTPTSSAGGSGVGLCSITRAGFMADIYTFDGFTLGIGLDYGNRQGAGKYSGNWGDLAISLRKGF